MKIVFFGTPQFAVPTLEKLIEHPNFEVIAIVTQPDKRRGRGNQMMPSAVKKVALEHHIPVWQPKRIKKDRETLTKLTQSQADVFVVVAYGQILSTEMLQMPKLGCINVHGSILPKYRGAAPIQWSIYHGDQETGITTMLMDEGMDTGNMLLKAYTPIELLDNAHQIAATLASQGADLLIETLLKLPALQPIPQDDSQATYARLIDKSDYAIDWFRTAIEIHNQVRGFFPNCVATLDNKPLKIMATVPVEAAYFTQLPAEFKTLKQRLTDLASLTGHPGEIVSIIKNFGAVVQTGTGLLLLKEVQVAGKRPQSGWDFVNGMRLSVGDRIDNG
ncbi:Methionyl-tRNA formyltransferase [Stanieria cyanosphaera PCC 7437]|uniref:Methionyl-tRNA formyltransferase n=1 Tax=Stanieria cyanosphaera (strain ATCC 29371 / PCC 7437) TaxID=111780 RepID=K9XR03_STAC7|nr:methionyl-tRNA formyltransferase [Stanieria cyanosphaera]AFZ34496.1 Methionyl-tRNA formyltransferase [Stanieria cyanosphaera PCC 7437]